MAKFSVTAVLSALAGNDEQRREDAVNQLEALPLGYFEDHPPRKRDVEGFVPQLADLLVTHRSPQVREWAAQMIGESGIPHPSAIQTLTRALKDKDRKVVRTSVWALGALRESAAEALPALLKQAKHPWVEVRWRVCWAVSEITGESPKAAKAMASLFADPERQVRIYAVLAFGKTAAPSKSAFARLEILKNDDNMFNALSQAQAALKRRQKS
jgi:HEAT repeat protein